jgi:hypothetical protein
MYVFLHFSVTFEKFRKKVPLFRINFNPPLFRGWGSDHGSAASPANETLLRPEAPVGIRVPLALRNFPVRKEAGWEDGKLGELVSEHMINLSPQIRRRKGMDPLGGKTKHIWNGWWIIEDFAVRISGPL